MTSSLITRPCLQVTMMVALMCFILGFAVQIFFHVMPSSSVSNLRAHNHFVIDGREVDVTSEDIMRMVNHETSKTSEVVSHLEAKPPPTHDEKVVVTTVPASSSLITEKEVPQIVSAWRNAKLDWHKLVPTHSSLWERFGLPKSEGKLPMLINKEMLITDYLTRFHESGLSSMYGNEHGPLQAYSGCNVFSSSCMIHDKQSCQRDQLCQWSAARELCVDSWDDSEKNLTPAKAQSCTNPKIMGDSGFMKTNAETCVHFVHEPAVLVNFDSESQSMFYHFWASWSGLVKHWRENLSSRRDVHYFMAEINDPMFFPFFGLLSDNCWRRVGVRYNPPSVCYCDTHAYQASQSRDSASAAADQMVSYLGLEGTQPPRDKVKVGLISRRRKRFILNEYELVQRVVSMGYECVILPLEEMTLFEQMQQLRSLDVLVGMHGSALDNSVFLHPGSVLVQLLPYKVEHRCTFRASAEEAGVKYMEWQLKDPTKAVFHWDLLYQANAEALRSRSQQEYLDRGQAKADNRETLMFWINQVR